MNCTLHQNIVEPYETIVECEFIASNKKRKGIEENKYFLSTTCI